MIYRLDDLYESQDFEHDQKFVKAEHWKEACDELEDKVKTIAFKDQEITKLKKALEIANEAIGFYGDKGNWFYDYGMYQNEFKSIAEEDSEVFDIEGKLIPKHYGGKRAREAQKQIQEIMESK